MTRVLLVPGRSPAGPAHWMTLWAEAHPEYVWGLLAQLLAEA